MNPRRPVCSGWLPAAAGITLWLSSCTITWAQLSASKEQLEKMFGPAVRQNARIWHGVLYNTNVVDGDIYHKGDLFVRAASFKDQVVLLEVTATNRLLQQKDVDEYLAQSAGGSRWELGKDSTEKSKFYHRLDNGAIAQWAVGEFGSLLISTENGPRNQVEDKLLQ